MPKYKDKSDDCNFSEAIVSIGDIRKMFNEGYTWDGEDAICDKLEELENRIHFIETHINIDRIKANSGWTLNN